MTAIEVIAANVLQEGLGDWVSIDSLIWHSKEASVSSSRGEFKELVVAAVAFLLREGLAVIGDIGDSGFEAWDLPQEEALKKLIAGCDAVGWELRLGSVGSPILQGAMNI